jgi:UDP-2-acetamido-3-amino-2,3-dideoxy-glucuronate N-acetyltransferase
VSRYKILDGEGLMLKVAVVGAGYWGKNLLRVFNELGVLYAICER